MVRTVALEMVAVVACMVNVVAFVVEVVLALGSGSGGGGGGCGGESINVAEVNRCYY